MFELIGVPFLRILAFTRCWRRSINTTRPYRRHSSESGSHSRQRPGVDRRCLEFPSMEPWWQTLAKLAEQSLYVFHCCTIQKIQSSLSGTPTTVRPTNASWIGISSGCGMRASIWSCLTGTHPSPKRPLIILLVTAILTTRSKSASENPHGAAPLKTNPYADKMQFHHVTNHGMLGFPRGPWNMPARTS